MTREKVKDFWNLKTGINIEVASKTDSLVEMVIITGLMVENFKDNSKMAEEMERDYLSILIQISSLAFGMKENWRTKLGLKKRQGKQSSAIGEMAKNWKR